MENIETLLAAVAQTQGFDDDDDDQPLVSTAQAKNRDTSPPVVRSGTQLVCEVSRPSAVVVTAAVGQVEKHKRGRPSKWQLGAKPPPPKRIKPEDEEEDVCFICFDGGSLVLCDRKGCPKAYHPACIKRDEAFFQSKAKWNCGWHICSVCRKASHYICYTCTYSLCKGCTKDTDYVCVRGNKGFCSTCMKTIMLIENKDQDNNESVQVDFDDKSSWEYLFKVYWVLLKEKLSLTLSELTQATQPWKGLAAVASNQKLGYMLQSAVGGEAPVSYRSTQHLELKKPQVETSLLQNDGVRTAVSGTSNHVEKLNSEKWEDEPCNSKDTIKPSMDRVNGETSIEKANSGLGTKGATKDAGIMQDRECHSVVKDIDKPCISRSTKDKYLNKPENGSSSEWASKDLLEFVALMKNGDTSAISQFDVQTLLLDYIKRNNLRDPRRKSQIICDLRLKNLFGKPRVGHIEMLKLLEFHFLIKGDSQNNSFIPAGIVGSVASDMEADGNTYELPTPINSRKRKGRKKSEERVFPNTINEYAAIDVHNINLIYLRRNLTENLIEDHDNFNNKVIGSIVRIRISSNDQKPDVYRLVQVVGTSKVAEPYKVGDRTVDIMLEVLNLDKKEIVSIDTISNQEFTEDECRRLRQSIRCGLVKRFSVGEVQKKAMSLQLVRVNDWLEAEISRLNHLRDRASEKGRKKELREYVDKLQLLKSPEERQRRVSEVPEVHADPKMSPDYESEEDTRSGDNSKTDEHVRRSYSFRRDARKPLSPNKMGKKEERSTQAQKRIIKTDARGIHSSEKHTNQVNIANSAAGSRNDRAMQRSGLETSTAAASAENSSPPTNTIETEKLWHYRDPKGKIQGPFSIMQLRKWSTTGLFPPDMRIWTNHEQYDSLLLTDALNGKFHGASDLSHKKPNLGLLEKNGATVGIGVSEGSTIEAGRESKQTEAAACSNNESVLSEKTATGHQVRTDESTPARWPQCWDMLKDNSSSADDDVRSGNLLPSSILEKTLTAPPYRGQEVGLQNGEKNSRGLIAQSKTTSGPELQNPSSNDDQEGPSSERDSRSLKIDLGSNDTESGSVVAPPVSPDVSRQAATKLDVMDLPSPTPKNQQSIISSDIPMQNSGGDILELLSPTPRSNNEDREEIEMKQSGGFINFPAPNSNWVGSGGGATNLGLEVADKWCGYSPTPAKPPPVQEWDSGIISEFSSKPPEPMSENIAASASHMSNWLAMINEPIEFDALGEESVSDLLAEVDAMEMQGSLPSPTSAMKFARELTEDCRDDCFSSIEEFSTATALPNNPLKSDAFSSTTEIQLSFSQSSVPCRPPTDAFDSFRRSSVHSSASSEGETNNNASVYSGDAGSEYHQPPNRDMVGANVGPTTLDGLDPGWGNVQGNINLVTVQGNVNLVLGGPSQGMGNLGWGGTNAGAVWGNPNMNRSPVNGSLPWEGQRGKYGGERFTSPREWGYQGRPPWGRQLYGGGGGGGGYSRSKGQRVCKFYESGRCKKGAFCDYLHP